MSNIYDMEPNLPQNSKVLMDRFFRTLNSTNRLHIIEEKINQLLFCEDYTLLSNEDQLSIKLFFGILIDSVKQGWEFRYDNSILKATPPDQANKKNKDLPEIKKRIRAGLEEARNDQINEPSIKKFILNLERPRSFKGREVSVLNHFLKPLDFYNDLNRRMNAPLEIRSELLENSIKPYLQLANDERDLYTNIKLKDIWRYTRYSWSLPLSSQPGRQMLYLIRDASREYHPIIGIGALGSSVAQISCRDNEIGWTIESLGEKGNLESRIPALEKGIEQGLKEIYSLDLLLEEDLNFPTRETLEKISGIIESLMNLKTVGKLNTESFFEDMLKPEYKLKRAVDIQELLHARIYFNEASKYTGNNIEKYKWLMERKEGKRALKVAIRNIKKIHMGSSIMDITTCGAVAPYNEILGGKLVSLLMASPQVINDYYEKYNEAVSEIASRKKGEKVIKPAKLALLATTSLYYTGSSQYNRIKYKTNKGIIEFKYVGKTRGFGSVQVSSKTYKGLQELLKSHSKLTPANSTFSAGVNFKMRSISTGLGHLGLRKLQQHENPRLVYIVPLLKNWQEYLTGTHDEPEYIYNMKEAERETQEIVKHWYKRWYISRVNKRDIVDRLKSIPSVKISDNFTEERKTLIEVSAAKPYQQLDLFGGVSMSNEHLLSWESLAELKDQRASFAEKLTSSEMEILHIQTKLDIGLINLLRNNKRIYLIGSPGDGKTHIIKKYLSEFPKDTFYNLDASAVEEDELVDNLNQAIFNNRPVVVAINEGPFRKIIKKLSPDENAVLKEQLDKPYLYGNEVDEEFDAVVINLGLRQVLSPSLLNESLNIILKKVNYENAPSIIKYNAEMLSRSRVRDRLIKLLGFLTKNGKHVTMHQLLGFWSFIITYGVTKHQFSNEIKYYYNAVFDKDNPLHDFLKDFDPIRITHPLVDMYLYDGGINGEKDWLKKPNGIEIETTNSFLDLKRRFFFEHEQGENLLKMLPEEYQTFYDLLSNEGGKNRAKKKIIEALSSYFSQDPNENKLQVWTGLKYEAKRDPTVFISSEAINEDHIEIFIPSIRTQSSELLEFEPANIRLIVRPNSQSLETVGLDVDLELWLSLMKIKRGISNLYQDPVIVRRLTTFMSQLASQLDREIKSDLTIKVHDTESGSSYEVVVSYEQGKRGKYYW